MLSHYKASGFSQGLFTRIPTSHLSPSAGRPQDPKRGDYWTEGGSRIYVCVDDKGTVRTR